MSDFWQILKVQGPKKYSKNHLKPFCSFPSVETIYVKFIFEVGMHSMCLPSCGPGFESQAHQLSFLISIFLNWNCNCYWEENRQKWTKRGRIGRYLKSIFGKFKNNIKTNFLPNFCNISVNEQSFEECEERDWKFRHIISYLKSPISTCFWPITIDFLNSYWCKNIVCLSPTTTMNLVGVSSHYT